ncbi:protein of unknown function [Chryseolinea serpens]|uniref:DUF3857 domain-containing protein n=1 Tax=Chryseolinea serpens TaxID=947013 RepID=A0A1M5KHH5_9BACT|nr:DUF3857 domain-containing protein [Chryseolinea serpens]SHG52296.1 protein of unknown function [Chryseolinea serpens]
MKKVLLACIVPFLIIVAAQAQSEVEKKVKQKIWGQAPAEFNATQVPEKWKNESAVLLAYHREYICDFATKVGIGAQRYYVETLNIHFRIKLQDKAAVGDFSDISFDNKSITTNLFGRASSYRILGIKVIKPDGSQKEVDLKDAVKADAGSGDDLKIPIPNLAEGDIIDYFIALKTEGLAMPDFGDEDLMEAKYPVVKQTITFMVPHQMELYSTSYNGAPGFKKVVKDNDVIYTLQDEMREKAPQILWDYPYRSAPHIRYRVRKEDMKPDVTKTAKEYLNYFSTYPTDIGVIVDYMDVNFKKEKDVKKLIEEFFYLVRNPIYKEALFEIKQGEPLNSNNPPDKFFFLVDHFCKKYKIPHTVLLAPARSYGPFEELVSLGSCDFVVRIDTDPVMYIARPTPFRLPDEIPYSLEGTDAFSVYSSKGNTIRVSKDDQNATLTNITAALDASDNTKLQIKRNVSAKGYSKTYHQYLVVTDFDYLKEYDQPKYQVERSRLLHGLIKEYNEEKTKFGQRVTQDYTARDTRMKEELEEEMEIKVSDYKNLTVKSSGMWHANPSVEYTDEFTAENLTKRAGPNIIVELGRLIEKQTQIKDDQKNRTRNIYQDFARSFDHTIAFTIPAGYTVEGLENFNKKTESAAGGFVSTATSDGKTVTIKIRKHYAENYYAAADWPKLNAFLQAAVDLYSAKLLLKKA